MVLVSLRQWHHCSSRCILSVSVGFLSSKCITYSSILARCDIILKLLDVDSGFIRKHGLRIAQFVVPFLIVGLVVLLLYAVLDKKTASLIVGGMFIYFVPPAGKESIIPITIGALQVIETYQSSPWDIVLVGLCMAFMDIIIGIFLLWNFDLAEKLPFLGEWIKRFEEVGRQKLEERAWVRRVAFIGVTLFVVFPFQGSGGVGATIMGRIIGMNKYKVLGAITLGGISGCLLIAGIAYYAGEAILAVFETGFFRGVSVLIVLAVLGGLFYVYKKKQKSSQA